MSRRADPGRPDPASDTRQSKPADAPRDGVPSDVGATERAASSPVSARVTSALQRASGSVTGRLAELASRVDASRSSRRSSADGAAYEAAMREAFRSAVPPEPARLTRGPAAHGQATPSSATLDPGAALNGATPAPGGPPASATRALEGPPTPPAPQPAVDTRLTDTPEWWPVRPATPSTVSREAGASVVGPAPADPAAPTLPAGSPANVTADPTAGGTGPAGGPATADDLLEVPGSVTTRADDFFGGVVRRVERHP